MLCCTVVRQLFQQEGGQSCETNKVCLKPSLLPECMYTNELISNYRHAHWGIGSSLLLPAC